MTDIPARLAAALADRYTLERELGQGGMATVYLARDLRHDRRVAIKVLRPELGAVIGAERFLSEIRTTANLQHPHILPLHDSGEAAGLLWYAMPFVEGESLRDRLARETQLPVADAVRIATEVAGALDYAHRHGVIHRDIKPENVLLQDGRALVADFGIALAARRADTQGRMTETGMSLGTPHYMSPEQAMGERELDARSDVYALGAMTYELLAGEPPFTGPSAQAIVAKVMTAEPEPVTSYRKTVPPHVAAAVATALQKLPADRFPSAAAYADALANTAYRGAAGSVRLSARPPVHLTAALAAIAITAMGLAAWGWLRGPDAADGRRFSRHRLELPAPFDRLHGAAIAPDGAWIAFEIADSAAAPGSDETRIWARRRDEPDPVPVRGTDGVNISTFAPAGSRLAFLTDRTLKVVTLDDPAAPVTLVQADRFLGIGLAWATDGFIYGSVANHIWRVPQTGGALDTVATGGPGRAIRVSGALPTGGLLFATTNFRDPALDSLGVFDPASGDLVVLMPGSHPKYVRSGHLVYLTGSQQLAALPFDAERLEVLGAPRVIFEGVLAFVAGWGGHMAYLGGSATLPTPEIAIVGPDGDETIVDWAFAPGDRLPDGPAVSPDGTHLAVAIPEGDTVRVYVKQLDRGAPWPLLAGHQTARPAWSADGQWLGVVSQSWREGGEHLLRRRVGGSGDVVTLTGPVDGADLDLGHWSLEQPVVVGTPTGLSVLRLGQDSAPVPQLTTGAPHENPTLSPDGRWLAFEMRVGSEWRIFVRPFPDLDRALIPISDGAANDPAWSADGRTLYYAVPAAGGLDIEAARLTVGETLAVTGTERVAPLQAAFAERGDGWFFAVMPGRDRFVVVRYPPTDLSAVRGIVLADNLNVLLDSLVPHP